VLVFAVVGGGPAAVVHDPTKDSEASRETMHAVRIGKVTVN
jgi:hypothetical protein